MMPMRRECNIVLACNFQLDIEASDNREPAQTVQVTATIRITRDESAPAFTGLPYDDATVSENAEVGTEFYTKVVAYDQDLQGTMKYTVLGDMPAPTFFDINEDSGRLFVKSDLRQHDEMVYTVGLVF